MTDMKSRLKVFAVGFLIGCIVVAVIKLRKAPAEDAVVEEPKTTEEIQNEAVPGILKAYAERGVPMESQYIKASRTYAIDAERYRRALIIQGVAANQLLRIEETILKEEPMERIESARVMAADRVWVKLEDGLASSELSTVIKPEGYRILRFEKENSRYLIQIPKVEIESVYEAVTYLSGLKGLVAESSLQYLGE